MPCLIKITGDHTDLSLMIQGPGKLLAKLITQFFIVNSDIRYICIFYGGIASVHGNTFFLRLLHILFAFIRINWGNRQRLDICFQKIPDHIFLDFFLCLRIRRQDHHIRMIFFRRIFHSVTDGQPVFTAFGFCDNTDGYLFLFCFLC